MKREFKEKLIGTLIVPIGLIVIGIPFSMLVGWTLFTAILFWLVLTPAITIYLPLTISKNKGHLFESLVGMAIFYSIMIFMIYDHYKSDLFQIMMVSFVVNMIVVLLISRAKRHRKPIPEFQNNTF